ncbi:hypothetical protein ColLi_01090 [Colletotrichum liriopes]|uniref:Uncharacterized protein n=1 Tax=Colletotrichum liriopes TaxID=708192 RepID=A0AA37LNL5_9PEZI|nr:hypothetical protein ColLi_01090 [Colletotrichum liriopes]
MAVLIHKKPQPPLLPSDRDILPTNLNNFAHRISHAAAPIRMLAVSHNVRRDGAAPLNPTARDEPMEES